MLAMFYRANIWCFCFFYCYCLRWLWCCYFRLNSLPTKNMTSQHIRLTMLKSLPHIAIKYSKFICKFSNLHAHFYWILAWHCSEPFILSLSFSLSLSLSLLFTMFQCFRQQTKLNHDLRDIFQLMRFRRARYRIQKLYWPMFTFEMIRFLRTFHIFFRVMVCLVIFHPFARFIIAVKRHTINGSKKLVRCVHSRKINITLYIFIFTVKRTSNTKQSLTINIFAMAPSPYQK